MCGRQIYLDRLQTCVSSWPGRGGQRCLMSCEACEIARIFSITKLSLDLTELLQLKWLCIELQSSLIARSCPSPCNRGDKVCCVSIVSLAVTVMANETSNVLFWAAGQQHTAENRTPWALYCKPTPKVQTNTPSCGCPALPIVFNTLSPPEQLLAMNLNPIPHVFACYNNYKYSI